MDRRIWSWYWRIGLPPAWEEGVARAIEKLPRGELEKCRFSGPPQVVLKALQEKNDPMYNLLFCLAACDDLEKRYRERGIPEEVLLATLSDLRIWAENYEGETGSPGLGEIHWLIHHLSFEIFRLGRLQFQFSQGKMKFPEGEITMGTPLLAVHIPQGEPLLRQDCVASYQAAQAFFLRFFPEFSYRGFSCDSWLLDETLQELLPLSSNILAFQKDYQVISRKEGDDMLFWLFGRGMKKEQLKKDPAQTSLQQKAIAHLEGSGKFYVGYGIMMKPPR